MGNIYRQKLKDPRWQRKRLEILNRDSWKCQLCGATDKELQIHHRYYVNCEPWDYPNAALVALCGPCHHTESQIQTDYRDLQKHLVARGFKRETVATITATVKARRNNFTPAEIDAAVESFRESGHE